MINLRSNKLFVEDVPVKTLAKSYSTPLYAYSKGTIVSNLKKYKDSIQDHGLVCYAVKANSNIGILRILAEAGAGFDIVSGGELEKVLAAGGNAEKIVFSGVGKQTWEIEKALNAGIFCFNIESESEIAMIRSIGENRKMRGIRASLRVNPDVDPKTNPYISTGLKEHKFGIALERAEMLYLQYKDDPIISLKGIDCHIGSQLTDITPLLDAFKRIISLCDRLNKNGIRIDHIDIGGGLGVNYKDETVPEPKDLVDAILPEIKARNLKLIMEPGRSIVGNSGILITKIISLKSNGDKNFCIVDAGMNDLIRPSLYNAFHNIIPVNEYPEEEVKTWDVCGPICETSDFLGKQRNLRLRHGQLLAVMDAGAYCSSMASQYNSRPRPAEVIVDGLMSRIIRKRETISDLLAHEIF